MPRILVVDDEQDLLNSLKVTLLQAGLRVEIEADSERALRRVREERWDLVLVDLNMPKVHGLEVLEALMKVQPHAECIVLTAIDQAQTAVKAMRLGAFEYLTKPVQGARLVEAVREGLRRCGAAPAGEAKEVLEHPEAFASLVTQSPKVIAVFQAVERIAPTDECLLITGSTGTGKELLARAAHALSSRKDGPFVGVNMAAIPAEVFASQLFGHAVGAFGSTTSHVGYLQQAARGTLFLDEIAELDLTLQAKLLRVLAEREFFVVGESEPTRLEARLIVSSNHDLEAEVKRGRVRADLFHRVNATAVSLPSLAERPEDIPLLLEHFLRELSGSLGKAVTRLQPRTVELLTTCPFPGNVRELQNVVRQALLNEETGELRPSSLPPGYRKRLTPVAQGEGGLQPLAELERQHIARVLESTGNNVTRAAEVLGISRATLGRRLRAYREDA